MDRQTTCQPHGPVGGEGLDWLRSGHQMVAIDVGSAFSALLGSPVEVSPAGVEQLSYAEFLGRLENPCCLHLIGAEPLEERLTLDIDPSILYPMIDRMLGGGQDDEPPPRRPLTDIERALAGRVVRLFLEQLRRAWQGTGDIRFDVLQMASNPRLLRAMPSDESVALASFRVAIGNRQGMLRLCIPCRMIGQLVAKTVTSSKSDPSGVLRSDGVRDAARTEARKSVELTVTVAASKITADDLSTLQVGDILATDTPADAPAVVSIEGKPQFHAKPGAFRGRKAVRVVESIPPMVED